jgi:hypothetical protein
VSLVLCTPSTNTQTRSLTWCVHRISHRDINPDRIFRASFIARHHTSRGIVHCVVSSSRGIIAASSSSGIIHRTASSSRGILYRAASYRAALFIARHHHRAVFSIALHRIVRHYPSHGIVIARYSLSRGIVIVRHYPSHGIIIARYSLSRGIVIVRHYPSHGIIIERYSLSRRIVIVRHYPSHGIIIARYHPRGIIHLAVSFIAYCRSLPVCKSFSFGIQHASPHEFASSDVSLMHPCRPS